jgi:hypothetical protein
MSTPIIEDVWKDLLGPILAIVVVIALAGAYLMGWMGERPTAVILSVAFVGIVYLFPYFLAEAVMPRARDRLGFIVIAGSSTLITLAMVGFQVFPGDALANLVYRGGVRAQSFEQPAAGPLAVVVHTDMGQVEGSRAAYKLLLTQGDRRAIVEGAFVRTTNAARGKRMTAVKGAESHLVTRAFAPGPVQAKLVEWTGKQAGLSLEVYPQRCPRRAMQGLQLALLALALWVRRRVGHTSERVYLVHLTVAAVALSFALPGAVTPFEPVPRLFGTLLIGLIAAGLAGEILSWLVLKTVRKSAL